MSPVDTAIQYGSLEYGAISPNGKSVDLVIGGNLKQFQLDTGQVKNVFDEYPDFSTYRDTLIGLGGNFDWSPDGKYLAVTGYTSLNKEPIFLLNPQTHTITEADKRADGFQLWSPFNAGRYMASLVNDDWAVFDLKGSAPVPLHWQYDFRQEKEVGGTGRYLWSKSLDIPVALLEGDAIISFADPMDYGHPSYSVTFLNNPQHLVGEIFDPTGEYVLVAQWECADTETVKCSNSAIPPVTDNVTDTVLTLIRWRMGERYELFRLSQIDPKNVVASGDLAWSADGSTILIGRYEAPFVVLKVK